MVKLWVRPEMFEIGAMTFHNGRQALQRGKDINEVACALWRESPRIKVDELCRVLERIYGWTSRECAMFVDILRTIERPHDPECPDDAARWIPAVLLLYVQRYSKDVAQPAEQAQRAAAVWPAAEAEGAVGSSSPLATSPVRSRRAPVASPTQSSPAMHAAIHGSPPHVVHGRGRPSPPPAARSGDAAHSPPPSPGAPTSPASPASPSSPTALHARALHLYATEEAHRLRFVRAHAATLIGLLFANEVATKTGPKVKAWHVDALGCLFSGGRDYWHHCARLSRLVPAFAEGGDAATITVGDLRDWVERHLTLNEVANPPASPSNHREDTGEGSTGPKSQGAGGGASLEGGEGAEHPYRRPLVLCGLHRSTVLKTAGDLMHLVRPEPTDAAGLPDAKVYHSRGLVAYLLAPLRYVSLVGLHRCTVVVGAAAQAVVLAHCTETKVIGAAYRVRAVSCADCILHVATPAAPTFSGDCRGMLVGPHNMNYPSLKQQLETPGMGILDACRTPEGGAWREAVVMERLGRKEGGGPVRAVECEGVAAAVEPADFFAFVPPVPGQVREKVSPFPVPSAYSDAMRTREVTARELHDVVQAAEGSMTEEQRQQVQGAVQHHFKEWLAETGNLRHITDLVRLERQMRQAETGHDGSRVLQGRVPSPEAASASGGRASE